MEKQTVNWKTIARISGAILAFAIGSGFATGQEVLQFFASYGFWGIAGAGVFLILNLFVWINFITTGQREKFNKGSEIFQYYCGKVIGTIFDYFTVIFIFMSFVIMIAGAASTLNQHYGFPLAVGGIVIAILACITVIFGLDTIVNVIGKIGQVIIVCTIGIAIYGLFINTTGITAGNALLPQLEVMQASKNWFLSAFSYVGFGLLWFAGFLAALGKTIESKKDAVLGVTVGTGALTLTIVFLSLALLGNIEQVAGSQIPILYLTDNIHPTFSIIYSIIIVAGIYTTAVPLLWTVSSRFAEEKTKRFTILTIVLAIIGCYIGLEIPFNKLVNVLYVINGYVGIVLLIFMVAKLVMRKYGVTSLKA